MQKASVEPKVIKISKRNKHIVDPWMATVARNQKVKFKAVDTDAIVLIPRGQRLFSARRAGYIIKYIKQGGEFTTPPRKRIAIGSRKRYHYAVYCLAKETFADKSSPVMLMEPP